MKKLFTLVAMAMMAVGANAQVLVTEKDWTGGFEGDYPMWKQFANEVDGVSTQGSIASDPDGVAITVNEKTGELWQPQVQILNEQTVPALVLEEDNTYKVVVTAKFPTDGTLQINMGSWSGRDQTTTDVVSTGDFQDVEIVFEGYAYNVDGVDTKGFVLWQGGDFLGTSIVKKVQVWNMSADPTGIKDVKNKVQNNVRYNLAGQKVDANYKGAVIMNGKKYIQK